MPHEAMDVRPPGAAALDERRHLLEAALMATGLADEVAFDRVYRMTSAKLFGICLRICGERQAAEEVLQEVYLTVWLRAPSFEPGRSSPITWLATIARNRSIDWRRANLRPVPAATNDEAGPAFEPADPAPFADAAIMEDQKARRLAECLRELDDRPRRAIRSAFMDGLTYNELAQREGVPLPTMKSWVRRGLLRLRDCMTDDA